MTIEKLNKMVEYDSDDVDKYKDETIFTQETSEIEETPNLGTLKITEALAKQVAIAIAERIKATKDYTEKRIARINNNYQIAESLIPTADADDSYIYPETFNSIQDWIDDLYLTFYSLEDSIQIEDDGNSLNEFISKKLEDYDFGGNKEMQFLASAYKQDQEETEEINKTTMREDYYYIQKRECIKEFIKWGLKKSGFKKNVEEFFRQGLISGLFCFKETWEQNKAKKIIMHKTKKGGQLGAFSYEIKQTPYYKFKVVDTRNLIFSKEGFDWIIEKDTNRTFSDLLNDTLDKDGKVKEDAIYDYEMLKKIAVVLKDQKMTSQESNSNMDTQSSEFEDVDEIRNIDGKLIIYCAYQMPLLVDGIKSPYLVETVFINDKYFPIRIQTEPFVELNFKFAPFIERNDDCAGMGLPEIIEKLQEVINNFLSFSIEIVDNSIRGISAGDDHYFENPEQLNNLQTGDHIRLKDTQGQNIDNIIKWFKGNLDALPYTTNLMTLVQQLIKRTSRKGPAGEKIQPNPTATEASSMIMEMEKSVNRVAIRLSLIFEEMLKNIYIYTLLNRQDDIALKVKAFKLKNNSQEFLNNKLGTNKKKLENISIIEKYIKVKLSDLYCDDLDFSITSIEKANKQAIEKQQAMQFLNTLKSLGYLDPIMKPDGTTEMKVITDEAGINYEVDQYRLLTDVGIKLGQPNFLRKVNTGSIEEMSPLSSPAMGAPKLPGEAGMEKGKLEIPEVPVSPEAGNQQGEAELLAQAQQV